MKASQSIGTVGRVLSALALVASFFWVSLVHKGTIGYGAETSGSRAVVVANANPLVVTLSALGIVLFSFLMQIEVRTGEVKAASLQERFAAFLFDMWFLFFTVIGISSFVHVLLEAMRTGTFRWQFERNYAVPSDSLDLLLILGNLVMMVFYFVLPLAKRRQTVGAWIFRLATVTPSGDVLNLPLSTAAWRVFMALNGLMHPIKTFKETDAQGRTWYDRETGFSVVRY